MVDKEPLPPPDYRLETDLDAIEVIKNRLKHPDKVYIVLEVSLEIDMDVFTTFHNDHALLEYLVEGELPAIVVKAVNPV